MRELPDIQKLITLYENEINSSRSGVLLSVGHSPARKELVRIGPDALPEVIAHLDKTSFAHRTPDEPQAAVNLGYAWVQVLKGIAIVHRLPDSPSTDSDRTGWLAWAKSHAPKSRPAQLPVEATLRARAA